jgi:putative copper resistance protein D
VTEPIILARAIHFAATTLAAGTVSFVVLVAEPAFGRIRSFATFRQRANLIAWSALAVAVLSGAAWLALLAADIYGASLLYVCLHGGVQNVLMGTQFGTVWSLRLAVALLLALLLQWPAARWAQMTAAAAFIALLAFVGHAGATTDIAGQVHLTSDAVHLIAAGAWLGALPALALLLATTPQPKGLATRAAARFSTLGVVSVAALLATGIVNSWMLLSSPRDLIATDYGRLLFLKIGLFAAMLAIAAVNRFYLTPRLAARSARRMLSRNSLVETALGCGVLLLVGALGTMEPAAHRHLPSLDIPPDAAFVHIHTEQAMADVLIDPGRTGTARATIRVMYEDSSIFPASEIRFSLDPPSAKPQSIVRTAVHQPDGTWRVDNLRLGAAGNWTVRVTIAQENGKPILLDAPITIAPAQ